jgi:hypothetical protein
VNSKNVDLDISSKDLRFKSRLNFNPTRKSPLTLDNFPMKKRLRSTVSQSLNLHRMLAAVQMDRLEATLDFK